LTPDTAEDRKQQSPQSVSENKPKNLFAIADSRQLNFESSIQPVQRLDVANLAKHFQPKESVWLFKSLNDWCLGSEKSSETFLLQGDTHNLAAALDSLALHWKGFDLKPLWHELGLDNPVAQWDGLLAAYSLQAGESMSWGEVFSRNIGIAPNDAAEPEEKFVDLKKLETKLRDLLGSRHRIYDDIELPLMSLLYRMERKGVKLDPQLLAVQGEELKNEIAALEAKIHECSGDSFNVASPKQLANVLFEKLALPAGKKTKTGYSTDNDVLEKLKGTHPIIESVLKFRELTKLKSTYVDSLPTLLGADGRIHTTFNQAIAATGRLSSIDPNLQNIPIRTERGTRVRRAFVAAPNKVLMSVDYSQIELRVLAHFSDDQNMIAAFNSDLDIHATTASEIFAVKVSEVTAEQRRTAKAVNFGIAYGQGAFGLAEVLDIPRKSAQEIIQRYFERFSGVQAYIEHTIKTAKEEGFVETLAGRRRYLKELSSSNAMIRKFGERAAINAPIQGTAADLVKQAMLEVAKNLKSDMILQVHDELIFEGPESLIRDEAPGIVAIMENIVKLKVPLKVNWALGANWDEAHA